jgi:transcriptional regulator with XRE-family HTH domain
MADQIGPAVARQRLRTRLKTLRTESRLTPREVVETTRISLSKLNRVENGVVTIQPVEVKALLNLYGVHDPEEVAELMNLADVSRRRAWWNSELKPGEYRDFIAYEDEASRITVSQGLILPGLLQTEEYARAITAAIVRRPADHPEVEKRVAVRLRRQRELFQRMDEPEPPTLLALIDGAVLERRIGGNDAMRRQLDHLLDLAERPHIEIVVVPLRQGAHAGLGGDFGVLEFAGSGDPDVVFIESPVRDFIVTDPKITQDYHEIANATAAAGLAGDDALKEIRAIRDAL